MSKRGSPKDQRNSDLPTVRHCYKDVTAVQTFVNSKRAIARPISLSLRRFFTRRTRRRKHERRRVASTSNKGGAPRATMAFSEGNCQILVGVDAPCAVYAAVFLCPIDLGRALRANREADPSAVPTLNGDR
jgi:hypothetical protein